MAIIGFIVLMVFAVWLVYHGALFIRASALFGQFACWLGAGAIVVGLVVGYFTLKYAPFTLTFTPT